MLSARHAIIFSAALLVPFGALATQPKIDADTCTSLRLEQIKFRQSGILDDMSKGAEWAKANLPADRLREIEHYLELDEQVKFGCRDAKLSPEAERASEAAARIEINSDADPTAPNATDPPKPGGADKPEKKTTPKKSAKKKAKPSESKAEVKPAKAAKSKESKAGSVPQPPVVMETPSAPQAGVPGTSGSASFFVNAPAAQGSSVPAFGFGETTTSPSSAP